MTQASNRITVHAHAKINWFLHVTGRIAQGPHQGYHTLESVFSQISLADEITIEPLPISALEHLNPIPGVAAQNDLVIRAAAALQHATGCNQGARIGVTKRIPMGGGLGGGSSDAATVLLALNELWQTGLSREQLMPIGLRLGADVPFFLLTSDAPGHPTSYKSAFASGVGETLTGLNLPAQWLVLGVPNVQVPTPTIFKDPELKRDSSNVSTHSFEQHMQQIEASQAALFGANDLQPVATRLYPPVQYAIDLISQHLPPGRVRMSGSGGCVYGLASSQAQAEEICAIVMGCTDHKIKFHVVTTLS